MAWIDDRIWCHPKFADLSSDAAWTYVKGVAYASGMGTGGRLTSGQQQLIGCVPKSRKELVKNGLWDEVKTDEKWAVDIHDWSEHNGKRDARRKADRERKRLSRSAGQSAGRPQDAPQDAPQPVLARARRGDHRRAPDDGSDLETKDGEGPVTSTVHFSKAVKNPRPPASETRNEPELEANGLGHISEAIEATLRNTER